MSSLTKSGTSTSSSTGSTGRSTSRRPPARLSWPDSLVIGKNDTNIRGSKTKHPRKRLRLSQLGPEEAVLWVEKFSPSTSIDLCVAPKKIKECKAWLQEATPPPSGNDSRLLVLVGSPGVGKSTMVRVLAKELGVEVHSWNESFVARDRGRGNFDHAFSVEQTSALDSFEEFLGQCGAGFSSLQLSTDKENTVKRSLILLEDLPNLHGREAAIRFRKIMTDHLGGSQVPTILIFSDVSEGKHRPSDLERLIDPIDLYSSHARICQIHPVTKPKMKKILDKIAGLQNCEISSTFLEELHLQSGGDVRHAIMTLQLQSTGLTSLPMTADRTTRQNDRDKKLSTFHALGKILYAKRTTDDDGKQRLAFDPEEILERSDLGVGGSLRFLEYHSAEFFTDVEDLDDAYSLFSDAATLLDNQDTVRKPTRPVIGQ
jgi:cell cycle checkpoint protein